MVACDDIMQMTIDRKSSIVASSLEATKLLLIPIPSSFVPGSSKSWVISVRTPLRIMLGGESSPPLSGLFLVRKRDFLTLALSTIRYGWYRTLRKWKLSHLSVGVWWRIWRMLNWECEDRIWRLHRHETANREMGTCKVCSNGSSRPLYICTQF